MTDLLQEMNKVSWWSELGSEIHASFCKVEAVCSNGEINWLGWLVLIVAALIILYLAVLVAENG